MAAFDTVLGTGGIGSGIIFKLKGNGDLGRNESRMATRVPQRDFCKLHIIMHYVALLSHDLGLKTRFFPIGAVGSDDVGQAMLLSMKESGMDLRHVRVCKTAATLFAVCYQFPDHTGGNITEEQSASDLVSPAMIDKAASLLKTNKGRSMVLAAPEVPLASRIRLLQRAKEHRAFTAASFVSGEMEIVRSKKLLKNIDLLAVNIDEAALLGGVSRRERPEKIVLACARAAFSVNPAIKMTITNGGKGAYACEGEQRLFLPSLNVPVANTAGAGDAWFSGLLFGTLRGLPFISSDSINCVELARLVSGMSVMSEDTINFGINMRTLAVFARRQGRGELVRRLRQG